MNQRLRLRCAAALLGLAACGAQARVYVVTANDDMTFTPAQITIYQRDVVRFVNGGNLPHNVHADDGSFTCAVDCNLHTAPNDTHWQVSRTFNSLGTIGYYCDAHGNLAGGMRGTIVVIDRVFVDSFDAEGGNRE